MVQQLISVRELNQKLDKPGLVVLDASMKKPLPGVTNQVHDAFIPGARIFDIETIFVDENAIYPHTLPSPDKAQHLARQLGLENDSEIVVYDNMGLYSAPRGWWMLKAMGANNVKVLNGGLPAWQAAGLETVSSATKVKQGGFSASYQDSYFIEAQDILSCLGTGQIKVLDARSAARFYGEEPEPRAGVRSGHIPGAQCLHFRSLTDNGYLKSGKALQLLFAEQKITASDTLVFSCGSGITACILALAAAEAGFNNLRVYDGSWAEWGSNSELPVALTD